MANLSMTQNPVSPNQISFGGSAATPPPPSEPVALASIDAIRVNVELIAGCVDGIYQRTGAWQLPTEVQKEPGTPDAGSDDLLSRLQFLSQAVSRIARKVVDISQVV